MAFANALPSGDRGGMRARGFTLVSVHAHDLDASEKFYREPFGPERIPSPDSPFPVRWLRVGNLELYLRDQGPCGHFENRHVPKVARLLAEPLHQIV